MLIGRRQNDFMKNRVDVIEKKMQDTHIKTNIMLGKETNFTHRKVVDDNGVEQCADSIIRTSVSTCNTARHVQYIRQY